MTLKVYRLSPADSYEGLLCVDGDDYELFADFDGTSRAAGWRPVPVERFASNNGRDDVPADFPWFRTSAPAMRRRAVEALRDLLEPYGEILPLATADDVELWVFNATRVIDALDEERSQIWRYPATGQVNIIHAPMFRAEVVRDVALFKLPLELINELFVGQAFVDRVQEAGLVGIDFELAWSLEGGPVRQRMF